MTVQTKIEYSRYKYTSSHNFYGIKKCDCSVNDRKTSFTALWTIRQHFTMDRFTCVFSLITNRKGRKCCHKCLSVILFTIGLMATRLLLIHVTARSVRILLVCFLVFMKLLTCQCCICYTCILTTAKKVKVAN